MAWLSRPLFISDCSHLYTPERFTVTGLHKLIILEHGWRNTATVSQYALRSRVPSGDGLSPWLGIIILTATFLLDISYRDHNVIVVLDLLHLCSLFRHLCLYDRIFLFPFYFRVSWRHALLGTSLDFLQRLLKVVLPYRRLILWLWSLFEGSWAIGPPWHCLCCGRLFDDVLLAHVSQNVALCRFL